MNRRFLKHKKAFELSASMIVIIIISIVIFTSSIYFVKKFFSSAEEIKGEIERSTQAQIESLLREGGVIAIPINKKVVKKGQSAAFGLGVRNIGGTGPRNFAIKVNFHKAFNPSGTEEFDLASGAYIDENWLLYSDQSFPLDPNDFKLLPISVTVDSGMDDGIGTRPGNYVFNVCVFISDTPAYQECSIDAYKQGALTDLYNNKVYQIFVEVPA